LAEKFCDETFYILTEAGYTPGYLEEAKSVDSAELAGLAAGYMLGSQPCKWMDGEDGFLCGVWMLSPYYHKKLTKLILKICKRCLQEVYYSNRNRDRCVSVAREIIATISKANRPFRKRTLEKADKRYRWPLKKWEEEGMPW
jgi:hypothetical protein